MVLTNNQEIVVVFLLDLLDLFDLLTKRCRMKNKEKEASEASTVGEFVAAMLKLPQDLPLYVRCKYTGETDWTQDCPIRVSGLSEMVPSKNLNKKHACILY